MNARKRQRVQESAAAASPQERGLSNEAFFLSEGVLPEQPHSSNVFLGSSSEMQQQQQQPSVPILPQVSPSLYRFAASTAPQQQHQQQQQQATQLLDPRLFSNQQPSEITSGSHQHAAAAPDTGRFPPFMGNNNNNNNNNTRNQQQYHQQQQQQQLEKTSLDRLIDRFIDSADQINDTNTFNNIVTGRNKEIAGAGYPSVPLAGSTNFAVRPMMAYSSSSSSNTNEASSFHGGPSAAPPEQMQLSNTLLQATTAPLVLGNPTMAAAGSSSNSNIVGMLGAGGNAAPLAQFVSSSGGAVGGASFNNNNNSSPSFASSTNEDDNDNNNNNNNLASSRSLYIATDEMAMSPYQCLVRQQLEYFAAQAEDVRDGSKGRNRPLHLGQVGIRCRHCSGIPVRERSRGSSYYPSSLDGIYQSAQHLAKGHLRLHCKLIPTSLREQLETLSGNSAKRSYKQGGKSYWAHGARQCGVSQVEDRLVFARRR